jgi:hypothetical protein
LSCGLNKLTRLDVRENKQLLHLLCDNNNLSTTSLDVLFVTLPDLSNSDNSGDIVIWNNPGVNDCDRTIAQRKKWIFGKK